MLPEPISFIDAVKPIELPILSVTDLSLSLKQLVEGHFKRVRVRGEVSGFKRHTSGHAYFTLKDQDSVIDAVCWRGTYLKAQLEDGLEVIATGRLTTYPGRSKYQIVVDGAEAAGEGALLKVLLERKARLQAEGLFDHKRPLPLFPKTIGVITSATGAVIQDILHRLNDRYPCHVMVWPVLVQGPGAAEQITAAIQGFNALAQKPDLLIVARGGGSLEDLWCFNEENVVRAAADSYIPLISAVGHETDTTLIDWVSDLRAPTPTAAAELATPVLSQIRYTVQQHSQRLYNLVQRQLTTDGIHLTNLARALPSPQQVLEQTMLRVDDWGDRLSQAYGVFLAYKQQSLLFQKSRLRSPLTLLESESQKLSLFVDRMVYSQQQFFNQMADRLAWQSTCLEQNSYQRILKRGFSLITAGDHVVSSIDYFHQNPRTSLDLRFADGEVTVEAQLLND